MNEVIIREKMIATRFSCWCSFSKYTGKNTKSTDEKHNRNVFDIFLIHIHIVVFLFVVVWCGHKKA